MALKRITEEEMNAQGVIAAPDILNGTPAQNKAIFDRMVRSLVAPAVNACVDAIEEANGIAESKGYMEAKVYDPQGKKQDVFQYVEDQINGLTATTSYSKDETLAKETKTLFGLGEDAVPDDVFHVLSRFQNGLGNEYVWAKTTYTVGAGAVDSSGQSLNAPGGTATAQHTATFYNKADYVGKNFVLSEAFESYTFTYNTFKTVFTANTISALVGKFFYGYDGSVWIVDESTYVQEGGNNTCYFRQVAKAAATSAIVCYVNSPDPNAYPIDDGYTYVALGQLGAKVQIATGSYTGTGTYGASGAMSLTFDFAPKYVAILDVIYANSTDRGPYPLHQSNGVHNQLLTEGLYTTYRRYAGFSTNPTDTTLGKKSEDGKTISWYDTASASNMFNESGSKYFYIAIG